MTRALPGGRAPTAFAASLAIHVGIAAGLAAMTGGPMPGSGRPAFKPQLLFATLGSVQPAQASVKQPAAPPRLRTGDQERGSQSAGLPKPYYYPASELTERPLPLAAIEPRFPIGAPGTGRLKILLSINQQGSVDAVEITEAEPAEEFEQVTVEAFKEARFRPGYKNGIAVRSRLALEVRFGEPPPLPVQQPDMAALTLPENPNAYDAPDRIGIKTRRAR
jgi:TonB family protein